MRKILGAVAGAAMLSIATVASAADADGTIENVDTNANTITVGGFTYVVSENTSGTPLSELMEGDTVSINYEGGGGGGGQRTAISVNKKE